jgi:hypothetical protein
LFSFSIFLPLPRTETTSQQQTSTSQAEINKEILKSIGKRGSNPIDYNDIEEYLRNRYYDTSRQFAPLSYRPIERPEAVSRNVKTQTNAIVPGQSTKQSGKATSDNKASSETALNEANQEQVYAIDDLSNNINDDEDDSQLKYIYSLYRNRLSNNF